MGFSMSQQLAISSSSRSSSNNSNLGSSFLSLSKKAKKIRNRSTPSATSVNFIFFNEAKRPPAAREGEGVEREKERERDGGRVCVRVCEIDTQLDEAPRRSTLEKKNSRI